MRENRTHGSEGGEDGVLSYPYFIARGSTGFGSNLLHIKNESRFVALASRASRIYVQVSMYQAGRHTLEFKSVLPLMWDSRKVADPARSNVWEPKKYYEPLRSN